MHDVSSLIPRPSCVSFLPGSVEISAAATIAWSGTGAEACAELLAQYLRPATGYKLPVVVGDASRKGTLQLVQTGDPLPDDAGFYPEAYRLTSSGESIRLEAESAAGLARGIQTLRQLLPVGIYAATPRTQRWSVPCVEIQDTPRFRWRGLHVDVSRHFFGVEDVCRFIELLAQHRMNVCHLHLTDDQGWRVEIKKYPRLTEIGSMRACTLIGHERDRPRRYDSTPYGGFYTQEDLREIVAFAARRHVTVVPEIDMPGHMLGALAAYPELGNTSATLEPRCHWGISHSVLNAEDSTVNFMKDVLREVIDLFPSRFIHIGGDEAPKREWSDSPRAQALMVERGLHDEEQLQSWFIRQMGQFVTSCGRRLMGWDEILEGGLAEGAAVMSWRGEEGGIAAAKQGHDVVMAPQQYVYFDHFQDEPRDEERLCIGGMTTTSRVYAYEPIPGSLPNDRHHHVLGAQGQLWTEYIPDRDRLDYMAYPRTCALAEVLWSPQEGRCYPEFLQRLVLHRERFAVQGVNAHPRP